MGLELPIPAGSSTLYLHAGGDHHLALKGLVVVLVLASPRNPFPFQPFFSSQGGSLVPVAFPQFPISFSKPSAVTLDERSRDCSLIERLGGSVVLYQELRGLLFRGKQRLLKLFQLRSRRVG